MAAWRLCETQVRVGAMGGVFGLEYASCAAILALHGLWRRDVVEGLRLVEAEVVNYFNERKPTGDDPESQTVAAYLEAKKNEDLN